MQIVTKCCVLMIWSVTSPVIEHDVLTLTVAGESPISNGIWCIFFFALVRVNVACDFSLEIAILCVSYEHGDGHDDGLMTDENSLMLMNSVHL